MSKGSSRSLGGGSPKASVERPGRERLGQKAPRRSPELGAAQMHRSSPRSLSRGSEGPQQQQQRQSPRAALHLKTTSSDSNGAHAHHRGTPKPEDSHRRSPRSPLSESPARNQKKIGSRVADLETKLGHAQEELRKLREQLASAEAAQRGAQHELEEAKKLIPVNVAATGEQEEQEEHNGSIATQQIPQERDDDPVAEASPVEEGKIQADHTEIDAPELVPPAAAPAEPFPGKGDDVINVKMVEEDVEAGRDDVGEVTEEEAGAREEKKTEMTELEAKLAEKMEELERRSAENSALRKQLAEAETEVSSGRAREEETSSKLTQMVEELAQSEASAYQLGEQLRAAEGTKASLEADMKKVRVQTEQWRKAADAAAAVLSAPGAHGRRVAGRCPSMDKHLFDGLGSPLVVSGELEEGLGGGRRKGAGIRALGDLWKKRHKWR